jgi:PPOX class probable F420-dependent enzyme
MTQLNYTMKRGDQPVPLNEYPAIAAQLDEELVGWFTTVSPSGQPQSSAIWFLREGNSLLMYSSHKASRLGNLAANSRVAFNLRSDPRGDSVVTLEGHAEVGASTPAPGDHPGYTAKYGAEIERLGWNPDSFSRDFSVPIRMTFHRLRSWSPEPGA